MPKIVTPKRKKNQHCTPLVNTKSQNRSVHKYVRWLFTLQQLFTRFSSSILGDNNSVGDKKDNIATSLSRLIRSLGVNMEQN